MRTIKLISNTLEIYEKASRQRVSREKSTIYLHHNISGGEVVTAEVTTGILRKDFPLCM